MVKWAEYYHARSLSRMMFRRRMLHYASRRAETRQCGDQGASSSLPALIQSSPIEQMSGKHNISDDENVLGDSEAFGTHPALPAADTIENMPNACIDGNTKQSSFLEFYTHRAVKKRKWSLDSSSGEANYIGDAAPQANDKIAANIDAMTGDSDCATSLNGANKGSTNAGRPARDEGYSVSDGGASGELSSRIPEHSACKFSDLDAYSWERNPSIFRLMCENQLQGQPLSHSQTSSGENGTQAVISYVSHLSKEHNALARPGLCNALDRIISGLERYICRDTMGSSILGVLQEAKPDVYLDDGVASDKTDPDQVTGEDIFLSMLLSHNNQDLSNMVESLVSFVADDPVRELCGQSMSDNFSSQTLDQDQRTSLAYSALEKTLSSGPFKAFLDRLRNALRQREEIIHVLGMHIRGMLGRLKQIDLEAVASKSKQLVVAAEEFRKHTLEEASRIQGCHNARQEKEAADQRQQVEKVHNVLGRIAALDSAAERMKGLIDAQHAKDSAFRTDIKDLTRGLHEHILALIRNISDRKQPLSDKLAVFYARLNDEKLAVAKAFGETQSANSVLQQSYNTLLSEYNMHRCNYDGLNEAHTELAETLAIKSGYITELERQLDEVLKLNKFYEGQLLESDKVIKELKESKSKGLCDITAEMNKIKKVYFKENALLKVKIEELELELKNNK